MWEMESSQGSRRETSVPLDVPGRSGPGAGVSPGVIGGPRDEGWGTAVEVDCEPGTACACSKVTVGSGTGLRGVGLNHSVGVLRVSCRRRGWHSRHGLDIFDVLNCQTFKCLTSYFII